MSRLAIFSGALLSIWSQAACCPTPVTLAATGAKGAYVRAVPASGGQAADARAGLVEGAAGWPPAKVLHDGCTPGVNEIRELEASLGAGLAPTACPEIQALPVPELGADGGGAGADAGGEGAPRPLGFMPYCYEVGSLVLVVEAQESLTDRCKHVVGLALFPRGK